MASSVPIAARDGASARPTTGRFAPNIYWLCAANRGREMSHSKVVAWWIRDHASRPATIAATSLVSASLIQPTPDCSAISVTLAPALDGVLTVNRHAAIAMDEMPTTNGVAAVDDAVARVKVVGVELFGFG